MAMTMDYWPGVGSEVELRLKEGVAGAVTFGFRLGEYSFSTRICRSQTQLKRSVNA